MIHTIQDNPILQSIVNYINSKNIIIELKGQFQFSTKIIASINKSKIKIVMKTVETRNLSCFLEICNHRKGMERVHDSSLVYILDNVGNMAFNINNIGGTFDYRSRTYLQLYEIEPFFSIPSKPCPIEPEIVKRDWFKNNLVWYIIS